MKYEIPSKWRCDECHELHDDEDDARECCAPSITEIFSCPVCVKSFYHEEHAIDCCHDQWIDGEPPQPRITAAELEAAGQMRLPL